MSGRYWWCGAALVVGVACGTPAPQGEPTPAEPVAPEDSPGGEAPSSAETPAQPSPSASIDPQVEADVALIIGGTFSPDHLGPARYDEVVARAKADAPAYLDALDHFVAEASAARLADVYPSALLSLMDGTTARAIDSGRAALHRYEAAIAEAEAEQPAPEYLGRLASRGTTLRAWLKEHQAP